MENYTDMLGHINSKEDFLRFMRLFREDTQDSSLEGYFEALSAWTADMEGYYANAGIYLIKKSAFDLIPEDTMFHSTDLLEALVAAGRKVIRFPLNGTWIDIGNPQEYQKAKDLVKHLR